MNEQLDVVISAELLERYRQKYPAKKIIEDRVVESEGEKEAPFARLMHSSLSYSACLMIWGEPYISDLRKNRLLSQPIIKHFQLFASIIHNILEVLCATIPSRIYLVKTFAA
jgi:hypothetical protein